LKLSQAQRLKGLERENELLRRLVADLALANQHLCISPDLEIFFGTPGFGHLIPDSQMLGHLEMARSPS
jgi:hypothetical protein